MRPGPDGTIDDGQERLQVWHQYRMTHSLNVAWLGHHVTAAQMHALDDAWDVLVVREERRDWKRAHLIPAFPFLYIGVIRDIYARWASGHGHPAPPDLPARG